MCLAWSYLRPPEDGGEDSGGTKDKNVRIINTL